VIGGIVAKAFAGLYARTICHATEDLDRVKRALLNVVGEVVVSESKTEGHHGNPIVVLEAGVTDPKAIDGFFRRLGEKAVECMIESLDRRIDDGCNLFLKLDKQAAFLGNIQMAQNDDVISIRIKVRAFPAKADAVRRVIEDYIGTRRSIETIDSYNEDTSALNANAGVAKPGQRRKA
jgi:RNA binding exosome subunit